MLLTVDSCHGTTIVMSDCTIVRSEQHLYQTIVQFDNTIVLPRKLETGNIPDYLVCYCPLVCILFEVLRMTTVYPYHSDIHNWHTVLMGIHFHVSECSIINIYMLSLQRHPHVNI